MESQSTHGYCQDLFIIVFPGYGGWDNKKVIHQFLQKAEHSILTKHLGSIPLHGCLDTIVRRLVNLIKYYSCVILITLPPHYNLFNVLLFQHKHKFHSPLVPCLFHIFSTSIVKSHSKPMNRSSNKIAWLCCRSCREKGALWEMPLLGILLASHVYFIPTAPIRFFHFDITIII